MANRMVAAKRHPWAWWAVAACVALSAGWLDSPTLSADEIQATAARAEKSIDRETLNKHVHFLASDALEGRKANSRGGRAAGAFLAEQMEKYGLKPAGDPESYFQTFDSGRNILGLLPGSDPKLQDEIVVVCAHYDHVGYGSISNSFGPIGQIHNGADDNASGTSGVLSVIQAIHGLPQPPRRSILFAFWDAEEDGLLGSAHWTAKPTLPLERVKLAINVDMIGRLRDRKLELYGSRTMTGLRETLSRLNSSELKVDFTWTMMPNSDHYSFFAREIPALMLHTGLHENYHRPSDDPETINFEGLEDVSRYLLRIALHLANVDELGGFRSESRREGAGSQFLATRRRYQARPPRLGIQWPDGYEASPEKPGLPILAVVAATPAERAGLQTGDVLLSFAGEPLVDVPAFRQQIWEVDGEVELVLRSPLGEERKVQVTLEGSPIRVGVSAYSDSAEPRVAVVSRVIEGTAADRAGLKVDDRITSINGRRFAGSAELVELLRGLPGPFRLEVEREGRFLELKVEVGPPDGWRPRAAQADEPADEADQQADGNDTGSADDAAPGEATIPEQPVTSGRP